MSAVPYYVDCAHYSTARDLAALARVALDEPVFATLAQRTNWRTTTWRSASGAVRDRSLSNTNQLLSGGTNAYTGAYGVKTGTTDRARENLVSAAKNTGPGGKDVIVVVLRLRRRRCDHRQPVHRQHHAPRLGARSDTLGHHDLATGTRHLQPHGPRAREAA